MNPYPGGRPQPISQDNVDGSPKRTSTALVYIDSPEIKDTDPFTSPVKKRRLQKSPSTQSDQSGKCCSIKANGGYNPVLFFSLAYFGAAIMFLLTINIWKLPDLYYPTIGNLLPVRLLNTEPKRVLVLIVLWGMHYVRRFAEVLFIHSYKRGIPLHEAIGSIVYYSFFGFWMGWSINYHIQIGYRTPPDYIFVPGIGLYIVGGIGNCISHIQLRIMQKRSRRYNSKMYRSATSQHVLPDMGCFKLVSCPHYLFEVITWLGFALATFTLAAWTFFICSTIVLCIYSRKKHLAYKTEFDGDSGNPEYPRHRKALIPFII